jgi:ABC-type glycerol-3-phosphate transport system substrate-binding protein
MLSAHDSHQDRGSAGGGGGGSTSAAPSGLSLPDLSGQTVEVAGVWTGAEQANFTEVLKAFEAKTHATTKYTSTGDDIATVLGTRVKGGQPPDVALLPNLGLLQQLAKQGALTEATADVSAAVDKNYPPLWKKLCSVDGKLYGVDFIASNKSTVWYRAAAFAQAGVQEPKTWDEFLTTARTIADSGITPVSLGGGDGWTLTDWFENVYLRQAGPDKYDQLTEHKIPWTDQSVKDALTTLAQLWGQKDLIVPNALQTDFPKSVTQVFSDNPSGAIVYEGDFVASFVAAETKAKVGTDAKFFDFPSINNSPPSVVGGGSVAVAMKDAKGAQALLQFLASPEAAEPWAKRGGFTSANKNLDISVYSNDTARRIAQAVVDAGDRFRFDMSDLEPAAFGGTPGAGMWKDLQDFLNNPTNVDGTAAKLEADAAKAFK